MPDSVGTGSDRLDWSDDDIVPAIQVSIHSGPRDRFFVFAETTVR